MKIVITITKKNIDKKEKMNLELNSSSLVNKLFNNK